MPEQATATSPGGKPDASGAAAPLPWQGRLKAWLVERLNRRVLAILLGASLIANGGIFAYFQLRSTPVIAEPDSPEIELGSYEFRGPEAPVRGAEFSLSVSLLDGVEKVARGQLKSCRHRVQQAIEELLRAAHSGDFEDPTLNSLKRQMQEQINGVLGMRGISEVIITNLVLDRDWHPSDNKGQTAGSVSSSERPPG